jgi:ATP-dependent RNA helicase DHX57
MRRGGSGGTEADCNADVVRVVKAALVAGFYPHVVRVKHPETKYTQTQGGAVEKLHNSKDLRYFSKDLGRVFLHPTSVNFHCGKYESRWIVYSERVETAKVYIRDNTMVGSYALLLFGGDVRVLHDEGLVKVDGWATFQAPARIGVLVKELRQRVDQLLLDRINHPSAHLASTPIVRALLELLASEGH